ncbi:MAG: hypothetical protein ACI9B9_000703 [Halioglobus sp.]|jgi:hypothetical protein
MIKKLIAISSLALASVAMPSQAALLATWDVSATMSGQTEASGFTVNISGGGGGGTATLDSNGTFSLFGLNNIGLNLSIGFFGGADLDLAASGNVMGTYNPGTQQLSGNIATLSVSENSGCDGYGFAGGTVCAAIPGVIDFSAPFVLDASQGLADPITFDLVNDFSILLGNLGGVASLTMNLSNVVISPVPVPAAAWLFGSALLGLGAMKRKKA